MAVRPIDAYRLQEELKQIAHGMGRISIHISDMVKVMTRVVERQPTLTPPNEPLTIEQLREMDGEPVWVVDTTINRREWCYWKGGLAYSCEAYPEYYDPDEYGQWLSYRRPPEGDEDAGWTLRS